MIWSIAQGNANSNATTTVNGEPAYRKGDYFRAEIPVTNGIGQIWLSLTNLAVLNDGSNPDIATNFVGDKYVPQANQGFSYDADGNLTNDGRWVYVWDAENRLVSMTSSSLVTDSGNLKLEFDYDVRNRRHNKRSYRMIGGSWQLLSNHRFAYDNWNLIAELNATNTTTIRSYLWGADLSGSIYRAGGVGGLLSIRDGRYGEHLVSSDGSGNVMALINATNSSVTGCYEYGPFGEVLRQTGTSAKINPFRFSSKYQDDETDLLYFGYRFLDARLGRWLNRDPLAEIADLNVYAFAGNSPLVRIDLFGLANYWIAAQYTVKAYWFEYSAPFRWTLGQLGPLPLPIDFGEGPFPPPWVHTEVGYIFDDVGGITYFDTTGKRPENYKAPAGCYWLPGTLEYLSYHDSPAEQVDKYEDAMKDMFGDHDQIKREMTRTIRWRRKVCCP